MKKRILLISALVLCFSMSLFAQHGRVSYQAVVRDSTNHLVVNTPLSVVVKLTDSLDNFYSEHHLVTTNPNGMMSLWIGEGEYMSGTWNDIHWNKVSVESKIFRQSDGKHIVTHTVPISAVPYALYAENINEETLISFIEDYFDEHPVSPVQSDWTETNSDTASFIKNKPSFPTVNDGHLNLVFGGDTVVFTANQATNTTVNIDSIIHKLEERIAVLESETGSFVCGSDKVKDLNGNWYETVEIYSQCWLKTNLRTTKTKYGVDIPNGNSTLSEITAYYYKPTSNDSLIGYYYNWEAAKQACPRGWHLPTDAEWSTLITYLTSIASFKCSSNVEYLAKALAGTSDWTVRTEAGYPCEVGYQQANNNATGFSAYPAGEKNASGFVSLGKEANFWLYHDSGSTCRYLKYDGEKVYSSDPGKQNGFSVRCIKN